MGEKTSWWRLHEIAEVRMGQLGMKKADLASKYSGPSPQWFRAMKSHEGEPSIRHKASLDQLDVALGWPANTSWEFLREDRSGWSEAVLEDEADRLVNLPAPRPLTVVGLSVGEQEIRHFATIITARLRQLSGEDAAKLMSDIVRLAGMSS